MNVHSLINEKKYNLFQIHFFILAKIINILEYQQVTFAFYNVENFYAKTTSMENSFLPSNYAKWKDNRYETKVDRISHAISRIGFKETEKLPLFVGLAEVENEDVLKDVIENARVKKANYDFVFYESLDERKINVCCIYQKDKIKILHSEPIRVVFKDTYGSKSYTRDILYLESEFENKKFYIFVAHLPSKIDQEVNQEKRKILLSKIRQRIDDILAKDTDAKIIVMGDFNDTPTADNIRIELDTRAKVEEVKNTELYNPMVGLMSYQRGSLVHKKQWMLFDQIMFTKGFLTEKSKFKLTKIDIFDSAFLTQNIDKMGAFPNRTFIGSKYLGGYSDHFPVYAIIKY